MSLNSWFSTGIVCWIVGFPLWKSLFVDKIVFIISSIMSWSVLHRSWLLVCTVYQIIDSSFRPLLHILLRCTIPKGLSMLTCITNLAVSCGISIGISSFQCIDHSLLLTNLLFQLPRFFCLNLHLLHFQPHLFQLSLQFFFLISIFVLSFPARFSGSKKRRVGRLVTVLANQGALFLYPFLHRLLFGSGPCLCSFTFTFCFP
mmetsp:Transcript_25044/g.37860  ORF Transcript_25044/g.37860 Transcript_25044/m.37860 type:complete len:202 (-) Transcript_25044:177-782(-)